MGKKVVLFAVPGAFTPGCQVKHLPPYVEKYKEFKDKGVDIVGVVAANDAYVFALPFLHPFNSTLPSLFLWPFLPL